jgi:hypothetical protein
MRGTSQQRDAESREGGEAGPGWFKASRHGDAMELVKANPLALTLAWVIARRARWNPEAFNPHCLEMGEALLGDFEEYGMTRQQYRTTLANLQEWRFATIKPTTKGTVARLLDSRLFSVLPVEANQQTNHQKSVKPTNELTIGATIGLTTNQELKSMRAEDLPSQTHSAGGAGDGEQSNGRPGSLDDVLAHGATIGKNAAECRRFFAYWQARGWKLKNQLPCEDWKSLLATWTPRDQTHGARAGDRRRWHNRNEGTLNETAPGDFSEYEYSGSATLTPSPQQPAAPEPLHTPATPAPELAPAIGHATAEPPADAPARPPAESEVERQQRL